MAAFTEHPLGWAEEHPYVSAAVIVGGVAVIYWLFFSGSGSSSSSSADTAQTNMAAAYYAAEAQQAVAGTNLNIAQDQMQAQVQAQQIQAGAAVAINQSNNTASMAIAANGYQAATDQATIWANAQNVQNNDAMNTANTAAGYQAATSLAGYQAGLVTTALQTVVPQELALSGGYGNFYLPGTSGPFSVNTGAPTSINDLIGMGYSPSTATAIAHAGVPGA